MIHWRHRETFDDDRDISDAVIIQAMRIAKLYPSSSDEAAERLGISKSHFYAVLSRTVPLRPTTRALVLAGLRADELALADKIEAEMMRPLITKED